LAGDEGEAGQVQQVTERGLELDAGEGRAQAVVGAAAEGEVRVRCACGGEVVGAGVAGRVAVGGGEAEQDRVAGADRCSGEGEVAACEAGGGRGGRGGVAEELLDSGGQQVGAGT
jgi:hypothetical protein